MFNCAAQVWNHSFYWSSMTPEESRTVIGPLEDAIIRDFGSLEKLKKEFAANWIRPRVTPIDSI